MLKQPINAPPAESDTHTHTHTHTHTETHTPPGTRTAFPGILNTTKRGNNTYYTLWFLFPSSLSPCSQSSLCLPLIGPRPPSITPFVVQYTQYINKYSCCVSSGLWLAPSTAPQLVRDTGDTEEEPLPHPPPSGHSLLFVREVLEITMMCLCWFMIFLFSMRIINFSKPVNGNSYSETMQDLLLDRMRDGFCI